MGTSGSDNFNQTRNEIIQDAFQLIGVYGVGRTISAEDQSFAESLLNKMVKAWQAKGLHLWAKEEAVLFVADNVGEYTLSNDSSAARCTSADDAVVTELTSAHAALDTTIEVDSTAGMAASDIIGIVLDDDSVDWTTIVSVDSSTQVTITTGLSSAAADNNNVYAFTSRITKPLRIHNMRRVRGIDSGATSTQTEIPMLPLSHQDFFNLPAKTTNGLPTHYYYNPDRTDGKLYLWPRPNDPEFRFHFTYSRQLENFDAPGDNPDFPVEWLECLTYQLAVRLAPAFGRDEKAIAVLVPMAADMLKQLMDWNAEVEYVQFIPEQE